MPSNHENTVEVIPTSRRGQAHADGLRLPEVLAIIALCGGVVCAFPYSATASIFVQTPDGIGGVRYLSRDGYLYVHFSDEPLATVHRFSIDLCRPLRGGRALRALIELLESNPSVTADLDAPAPADEAEAAA